MDPAPDGDPYPPTPVPVGRDPPLSTWRTSDPDRVDAGTTAAVRDALAASPLLHHRRWPDALRGDPAAAIAVAIDVLVGQGPCTPNADIAVSRVLLDAAGRDPTAALVLAHALVRLARCTGSRELLDRADLWARRTPTAATKVGHP